MTIVENDKPSLISEFDAMQVDALREIGNIGAAHASTALTNLVKKTIMVDVPECFICKAEQLPSTFGNQEEVVVACFLDAIANEKGAILLLFPQEMAKSLSELLIGREPTLNRDLDEDDMAAVAEIGNICASAYLSAISQFLDQTMIPSPPAVAIDMLAAILQYPAALVAEQMDHVVVIKTRFIYEGNSYGGSILYLPDRESRRLLLNKFGLTQ